jgi:catechol 2,3-dioxygenase-like lactoylglutathione lyase family enzyme
MMGVPLAFQGDVRMAASPAATSRAALTSGGGPTIFVCDVEKAVRFYRDTLGLGVLYQAGPHFAMIDAGDGMQIGLHPPTSNTPAPGTRGSTADRGCRARTARPRREVR